MEINKLQRNNIIKYNNRYAKVLQALNYNEYLIEHCGKPIIVNILNIKLVEISNGDLKDLGFERIGKSSKFDAVEWKIVIEEMIGFEIKSKDMIINIYNDVEDLDLKEISGIESSLPDKYKYIHQLQNLLSYVTNVMPVY